MDGRPVILAVDDHPSVLSAVLRDLRRRYGREYRTLGADSGPAALELVRDLSTRNQPLSLMVVDQRMPEMTGGEFLREALRLYPGAKRVLLTAYADMDAAIQAINEVRLDHYLMKPWDPPEDRLYPILDDLLEDWRAGFEPPFDGVRIVGVRWSPEDHRIKDFLTRNQVPFRWLDVETDPEGARLAELSGANSDGLPLVFFPDGSSASRPDIADIGLRIGLRSQPRARSYDLVVVGAGPAGLAAGVYAASEGLSTLLVEGEVGPARGGCEHAGDLLGVPDPPDREAHERAQRQAVDEGGVVLRQAHQPGGGHDQGDGPQQG